MKGMLCTPATSLKSTQVYSPGWGTCLPRREMRSRHFWSGSELL